MDFRVLASQLSRRSISVVLDSLQILVYTLILLVIKYPRIGTKKSNNISGTENNTIGEFTWLFVNDVVGFTTQILLLLKLLGIIKNIQNFLLRGFYAAGCLTMLLIPCSVAAMIYFGSSNEGCGDPSNKSLTTEGSSCSNEGRGLTTVSIVFVLSIIQSVLAGFSFILAVNCWCDKDKQPENVDNSTEDETELPVDIRKDVIV